MLISFFLDRLSVTEDAAATAASAAATAATATAVALAFIAILFPTALCAISFFLVVTLHVKVEDHVEDLVSVAPHLIF